MGSRWLSSFGLSVVCVGLFLLAQVHAHTQPLDLIWRLALVGAGTGVFQSPNNRTLMQAAPGGEQGEASGVLRTGRVVGQSLSVAIAAAVFAAFGGLRANTQLAAAQSASQPLPPDQLASLPQTFISGLHAALIVCACMAAAGVATSLVRSKSS